MKSLYIHLPFCLKKCAYCDFVSYPDCYDLESQYIDALMTEFLPFRGEALKTVYLGGGTPTSLSTKGLTRLLDSIYQHFSVDKNAEVTIECNPKTADFEKFSALLSHGANRLSVGVQSFDDELLKILGRLHNAADGTNCILDAHRAGFSNISLDLMFGLPNQTVAQVEKSANYALTLPVSHISCYDLIVEEGTPLCDKIEKQDVALPDEDTDVSMYEAVTSIFPKNGFLQYEISNYAKPGFASRHNTNYWDCGEYIGCGCGAHSYLDKVRFSHPSDMKEYLKNPFAREEEIPLSKEDQMQEFMMLGLRKRDGVEKQDFCSKFGIPIKTQFGAQIEKYKALHLLEETDTHIRLTDNGIYVSNSVLCEFV